jgi:glycosyltransferase involved in cell wall biosynthesis
MKILLLHNSYHHFGGEDQVVQDEIALLRHHGHQVVTFFKSNKDVEVMSCFRALAMGAWNKAAYRAVRELIREEQPDIVHCHNIFVVASPAVYYAACAENVPVVQTLHNYRPYCINGLLYRDNRICETCVSKSVPWPGAIHSCYRGSRPESVALLGIILLHRVFRTWSRRISAHIAPTAFVKNKFVEAGLPSGKIHVKQHFVLHDPGVGPGERDFGLFIGRPSPEKGLPLLIDAWRSVSGGKKLKIAGVEPQDLRGRFGRNHDDDNIECLGMLPREDLYEVTKRAAFLVVPSLCYETFGLAIIEAFACGTPVIAPDVGSPAELIEERVTGLHFVAGNRDALVNILNHAWEDEGRLRTMGLAARKEYEKKYSAAVNHDLLMNIYHKLTGR